MTDDTTDAPTTATTTTATDADPAPRPDPVPDPRPDTGDELSQLLGFLEGQREIVLRKSADLDDESLRRPLPPSSLTLAGLLNHGALNEDYWFTVRLGGGGEPDTWQGVDWDADPDHEFAEALTLSGTTLRERYLASIARSNAVIAGITDLDAPAPKPNRDGGYFSARWIVLHMIEETARHAGHADFLREAIDGLTGE